jgi:hypothetical protein
MPREGLDAQRSRNILRRCFIVQRRRKESPSTSLRTPVEVTKAELDRIAALDPKLKSYATVMADSAMAQAKQAETDIGRARSKGPPRSSSSGQGSLLDDKHADCGGHDDP